MKYTEIQWQGFDGVEFVFEDYAAKVIKPRVAPNGKWALKTEYFDAFPQTEIELLNRGWHLAYHTNENRWAEEKDIARKADFVRFVSREFSLSSRCTMVGMSCGGMYAVLVAARCPELVDVLYLDAPVLNLLSCPCDMGVAKSGLYDEYYHYTGITKSELLSYRDHPIDHLPTLIKHDIPVVLVAGDSDQVVPYVENGAILARYFDQNGGKIRTYIKAGCDHHPHGLEDFRLIADQIEAFSRV